MTLHSKIELFRPELVLIKDPRVISLATYLIGRVPDYFFDIPASSSGKYHPEKARRKHGLIYHTKLVVHILTKLMDAHPFVLHPDRLIVACLFHDAIKQGFNGGNGHTVGNHPILAATFIKAVTSEYINKGGNTMSDEDKLFLINFACEVSTLIESHMGKWNNGYMPTPKTTDQILVHTADYLASQLDNLDLYPEECNLIFNSELYDDSGESKS